MKNFLQYVLGFAGVALIAMWQTGYNPFAGTGDTGRIVTAAELTALKKSTESDGERLAVIGHASVPSLKLTRVIGRPVRLIVESPENEMIDTFEFYHGKGQNEFFVPAKYTKEDLKLYDNEKKEHAYNENVRISFTMKRIKEAEPEMNPATKEYAWRYEQVRIDPVEKP